MSVVAQLTSFFLIGLLLVIPASVAVLTVTFGQTVSYWFASLFGLLWGVFFYSLSLWIAGIVLRRRMPEIVNWVQVV